MLLFGCSFQTAEGQSCRQSALGCALFIQQRATSWRQWKYNTALITWMFFWTATLPITTTTTIIIDWWCFNPKCNIYIYCVCMFRQRKRTKTVCLKQAIICLTTWVTLGHFYFVKVVLREKKKAADHCIKRQILKYIYGHKWLIVFPLN